LPEFIDQFPPLSHRASFSHVIGSFGSPLRGAGGCVVVVVGGGGATVAWTSTSVVGGAVVVGASVVVGAAVVVVGSTVVVVDGISHIVEELSSTMSATAAIASSLVCAFAGRLSRTTT
jgi:hypothetical protein